MLQGPSRGLCSAQTSGSPMTLSSATAAGSAPKAGVNLECVEAGPSIQAPGSARHVAPALGAPLIAISNPNPKQTQHGNDRRFYRDLLRAPIGEPYFAPDMLAPDMLLALCHHASTHDLSESAISKLLARPNLDGLGGEREKERERERAREREKERESDSDAVAAEADFEPVGDATKYCWEQDCAYPFDDAGLSARYFDQG